MNSIKIDKSIMKQINKRAHELAQKKYKTYQVIMLCAAHEWLSLGLDVGVYKHLAGRNEYNSLAEER